MQTKEAILAMAIAILILGCDNSPTARFANIEGLAGGYDKYEQGGFFCVLGYAQECEDAEKPEALQKFPFVAKFFRTQECQGTFIYLASKKKLSPDEAGKMLAVCGEWIKTPGLNYLFHHIEEK